MLCGLVVHKVGIVESNLRVALELVDIKKHFSRGLIAFLGIFLHSVEGNLLKALGDVGVNLRGLFCLLLHLHYGDGNSAVGLEGNCAREHFVKNHADRVDICLVVCDVSPCLLGADVVDGADGAFSRKSPCVAAAEPCDAEVCYLYSAVLKEHYVLGLYIPMNYALVMGMLKGSENLRHKMHSLSPVDLLLCFYIFLQRYAFYILHYNVLEPVAEINIVNLYNVRM